VTKFKRFVVLTAALLGVLAISGCSVSKGEHEKTIAELQQAKAELEQAKSKLAEIDKLMEVSKIDVKILDKLRSAQQKAGELSVKVKDLTIENEKLKKELAEMKAKKPRS
jgi:GTPase involved in cell partitioning and DNA repair